MYYKVMKNNKVIDVLDMLIYLKYQPKHNVMILCDENEAQAILSSDRKSIWHETSLYKIPVDGYDTVTVEEITDNRISRVVVKLDDENPESEDGDDASDRKEAGK